MQMLTVNAANLSNISWNVPRRGAPVYVVMVRALTAPTVGRAISAGNRHGRANYGEPPLSAGCVKACDRTWGKR